MLTGCLSEWFLPCSFCFVIGYQVIEVSGLFPVAGQSSVSPSGKVNFDLMSFLAGDIEGAVQSCAALEQQESLEELAASINKSFVSLIGLNFGAGRRRNVFLPLFEISINFSTQRCLFLSAYWN
ncbi:unnamed protein product [Calypogeia fissa]